MSNEEITIHEYFKKMSDDDFVNVLEEAGFKVEYVGEGKGGNFIMEDDEKAEDNKGSDINPAIAYTEVKDMLADKDDKESLMIWDYLYKLCIEECTHKHIDGTSSWSYPSEDIDYKVCSYCSLN